MRAYTLWMPLMVASVTLACDDDGATPSADTSTTSATTHEGDSYTRPDTPTPWIFEDDGGAVAPTLGAQQLQAAVNAALDATMELDPRVVKDLHDLVFPPPEPGSGDPTGCPFYLTYDYGTSQAYYWQGECTTEDGRAFSGYGYVATYTDQPTEGVGLLTGYQYYLAGRMQAADGTWIEGAGSVTDYGGGSDQLAVFSHAINGTFTAGGPRAPDSPWLDGTRRPSIDASGWLYTPTGGKNLVFSGGISGLTGFPGDVSAVSLDGLTVRTVTAGSACGTEFGGSASVRGPDGSWYDIVFDGPTEEDPDSTPPSLCDGCGDTFFRGAAIDPTCVSPVPYVRWESTPW